MRRDDYLKGPAAKIGVAVLGVLAILFIASQLIIPPMFEDEVAERLTKNGGKADVSVSAFPALSLLSSDGSEIKVRAHDLDFDLQRPPEQAFEKLDGFDKVDIKVTDSHVGPMAVSDFRLERPDEGTSYDLSLSGSVTGEEIARYAGDQLGGPIGQFFGNLAGEAIPGGDKKLPIEVDVDLRSEGGRAQVQDAAGSVAGIPLGPFAGLIAEAIVERL